MNIRVKIITTFKSGYEVELSSNIGKVIAFINDKNRVICGLGVNLHSLFDYPPYTKEFVKTIDVSVQEAFKDWVEAKENVFVEVIENNSQLTD